VFDEKPRREVTTRDDLAGGEASRRLGNRLLRDNLKGPLGLLGSEERKLEGGGSRGEVVAGVGTTTSARLGWWCGAPLSGEVARERACEGVRLGARA
jgi:hypothetical protein